MNSQPAGGHIYLTLILAALAAVVSSSSKDSTYRDISGFLRDGLNAGAYVPLDAMSDKFWC